MRLRPAGDFLNGQMIAIAGKLAAACLWFPGVLKMMQIFFVK
jgi:hypothetical protein